MAISFRCPACGAPLSYSGGDETTVQCAYCSNTVGVPAELRPTPAAAPAAPPTAPILLVPLPPTPPDDIRAAIKQMRETRRLERRLARHEARVLRHR